MNADEFRAFGKAAVDFIANYMETISDRPVLSSVKPGFIGEQLPKEAPETGESWEQILEDVNKIVLPGITHWQSPSFFAYYPTASSFPAIVGELLSAGFGSLGLSWVASPVYTELEVTMMNWLGKLLGLPEEFLNCADGPGGGVIQGSASETTFITLLAAKEKTVREIRALHPHMSEATIKGKLVAYASEQSNSSVEKAGMLSSVKMRLLLTDSDGQLRGHALQQAIDQDKRDGLIPCYVVGTLGTTSTCAFDSLEELGEICAQENIWLHVDAAYAGAAFVCPEYRHYMRGVEYAQSFNFNAHKWMLVNFDCSAMWIKDSSHLVDAFNVERIYLKDQHMNRTPEYRHWQISLGRRFRSLKVWFVLRAYGAEGIRKHIRHQIDLAKQFERLVSNDNRFEVISSRMGLVCFRLKGENSQTDELLQQISERKSIFVIAGHIHHLRVIRFAICSALTESEHVLHAWREIQAAANHIPDLERMEVAMTTTGSDKAQTISSMSTYQKINVEKTQ